MKRKNIWLLLAALIGTAYLIYILQYAFSAISSNDSNTALAASIATMMLIPHLILVLLAVIFNWLGFLFNIKWAALTAGICYGISMILFLYYFMFVIIEMIFCFIGYGKLNKQAKDNQ